MESVLVACFAAAPMVPDCPGLEYWAVDTAHLQTQGHIINGGRWARCCWKEAMNTTGGGRSQSGAGSGQNGARLGYGRLEHGSDTVGARGFRPWDAAFGIARSWAMSDDEVCPLTTVVRQNLKASTQSALMRH